MDALVDAGTNQVGVLAAMTGVLPAFDPAASSVPSGAGFLNLISLLMTPDTLVIPKSSDTSPPELAASLIRSMMSAPRMEPLNRDATPPPKQKQDRDDDQKASLSAPALPPIPLPPMDVPTPIPVPALPALPAIASKEAASPAPAKAEPQFEQPRRAVEPQSSANPGSSRSSPTAALAFGALLTRLDAEAAPAVQPPAPPVSQPAPATPEPAAPQDPIPAIPIPATQGKQLPQAQEAPAEQPSSQPAAAEARPKPISRNSGDRIAASTTTAADRGAEFTRVVNTSIVNATVNATMDPRTLPESLAPPHRTVAVAEPPRPVAADAIRGSEPVQPTAELPLRSSPAQEIAVRIAQPDAPAVDLHVTERNGQVQVAVRTPDAGFGTSLRQDLGTLVNSLERAGYHAVTFTPHATVAQASSTAAADPHGDRHDSHGGSLGNDSGASSDGRQQQHRRRAQDSQDWDSQDWLEELEKQS